jgi:RNA polymerase sigma-B factor
VEGFLPLAHNIAHRFRQRGEPIEDFQQVASLGLLHALDRFRPELCRDFLAYAIPTITGELRRHFRDKGWAVRVPRRLKDLYVAMSAATSELGQTLGRAPKPSELAHHLDLPIEEVLEGLEACAAYKSDSLDREQGTGRPGESQETLGDRHGKNDPGFGLTVELLALRPLLAELPAREHNILLMRFYDDMTQSQIADRLGISQMHVSRLLTQTLTRLRHQLQHDEPPDGTG